MVNICMIYTKLLHYLGNGMKDYFKLQQTKD